MFTIFVCFFYIFRQEKSVEQASNELREGKTYESSVDTQHVDVEDLEEIPPPIDSVMYRQIAIDQPRYVYFDIETTSLDRSCDIIQLAAVCGEAVFNRYVMPNKTITPQAEIVTNFQVLNGQLYYKQAPVNAITIAQCVAEFIQWLQNDVRGAIVLVGHNCKVFDAPRLMNHIALTGNLSAFNNAVVGFCDTLPMFRTVYKGQIKKFTQVNLAQCILDKEYNAHNAEDDAKTLEDIVQHSIATREDLKKHSFSVECVLQDTKRWQSRKLNESSFDEMRDKNVCSAGIVNKMSSSGLSFRSLRAACSRNGLSGIETLLSEKDSNGRIRVTKSKRIINAIYEFLQAK